MIERARLLEAAKRFGFGDLGICSTSGFEVQQSFVETQPPINERRQLRFYPAQDCPWATALLVLLWPYQPAPLPEGNGVFVDSYYFASNQAYHAARKMEGWLEQEGYRAKANVSFPARTAALRAGLGIVGHNSLLIHPEFGSRVVLILIATNAVCVESDKRSEEICLQCKRCVKVCPTGAIDQYGMRHPERCLRNFMMEGVVVPLEVREKMAMKLIGCDACQRACPMQPSGDFSVVDQLSLDTFMTLDETAFRSAVVRLGEQIGRNAARPQRVRAQAALLAGNRKDPKDIPVLEAWANTEFEAVQKHAAWALLQIEGSSQGLDQSNEKR